MYGIWRKICTSKPNENNIMTKGKKEYIGQTQSNEQAKKIYDILVGQSDIALTKDGADVWYGFDTLPNKSSNIHIIKNAHSFIHHYIKRFNL